MTPLQPLTWHAAAAAGVRVWIKRDDLNDPYVQGNKARKLAPLLAQRHMLKGILTMGGAYSNHLYAVAYAGAQAGISTVGIVRGTAANLDNATLTAARAAGMHLHRVSKVAYDAGFEDAAMQAIVQQYPDFVQLPSGGNTRAALEACKALGGEILAQLPQPLPQPLHICIAAGTGCTAAGLVAGLAGAAHTWVFPAAPLPADGLLAQQPAGHYTVVSPPAGRSFALKSDALLAFARQFRQETGVLLDPIYTLKMAYTLSQMLDKGTFAAGDTLVLVHTGGLQGWAGFQERWGVNVVDGC